MTRLARSTPVEGLKQRAKEHCTETRPGIYSGPDHKGRAIVRYTECMDCHTAWPHMFMLKPTVWAKLFDDRYAGIICWNCFQSRLGRRLVAQDLDPEIVLNDFWFRRLLRRSRYRSVRKHRGKKVLP